MNKYIRSIALISPHFNQLPEAIEKDELNEYPVARVRDSKSPAHSSFKQMVYGLQYYYHLLGLNKTIALPSIKKRHGILSKSNILEFTITAIKLHNLLQFIAQSIEITEKKQKSKETAYQVILEVTDW